jgi:hypothetical protein
VALLQTKVFVSSRRQTAIMFAGSLAFVAIAFLVPGSDQPAHWRTFAGSFFGLCAVVFVWLLVRPQRLTLDADGFTLSGGLMRPVNARKIYWRDVEPFFLYRMPGYRGLPGPKVIGLNFVGEASERPALARFNRERLGLDGSLPGLWPAGPEQMIQELNDYRERALRMSEKYGS